MLQKKWLSCILKIVITGQTKQNGNRHSKNVVDTQKKIKQICINKKFMKNDHKQLIEVKVIPINGESELC